MTCGASHDDELELIMPVSHLGYAHEITATIGRLDALEMLFASLLYTLLLWLVAI